MKVGGMIGATLQVLRKNNGVSPIKADKAITSKGMRQDVVSIGTRNPKKSEGKSETLDLIESLNEQIKSIRESKNSLIKETLESGKDIKQIESQLKNYDEQIKNIGDMITKINAEQNEKAKAETEKPIEEKKPATKEEANAKTLNNVVSLSASIDNAESLNAIKASTEASARVIEGQIKIDGELEYHHNDGSTQPISAAPKEALLARLEQSAVNLSAQISETLGEVQDTIQSTNDINPSDKADEQPTNEQASDMSASNNETKQTSDIYNARVSKYESIAQQTSLKKENERKPIFSAIA